LREGAGQSCPSDTPSQARCRASQQKLAVHHFGLGECNKRASVMERKTQISKHTLLVAIGRALSDCGQVREARGLHRLHWEGKVNTGV